MHLLPTCAITCGLQVTQRPIPTSFQTLGHPPHHSQDCRLYNKGPHAQVVAWEDHVEHWGKLSYEQGGTVLKVVSLERWGHLHPWRVPFPDTGGTRDLTWSLPDTTSAVFPWVLLCCRRC